MDFPRGKLLTLFTLILPHMSAWAHGHRNPLYRAPGTFEPCCEHERAQEKAHGHFKSPLNWALAPGIILHWDPLILCELRWNCHQQDKCIWRTWPCRSGLMLLMLFMKCWVWKTLPEVQMCLSIRDLPLVLLMQMQTFLRAFEETEQCSGDFRRTTLSP